jgi:Patatin-like phospholipase
VHEVVRVLGARTQAGSLPGERRDGFRVALAIEGGGMRGTISAGMALALDELGLVPAFDAVYGASAGAISGAWLLSRPQGLRGWTEPACARAFIRRSGLLRGRRVADVRALIEELYQTTFPMDFAAVLASPVEFHPLATDAATGQSTHGRLLRPRSSPAATPLTPPSHLPPRSPQRRSARRLTRAARRTRCPALPRSTDDPRGRRSDHRHPRWQGRHWPRLPRRPNGTRCAG